MKSLTLLLFLLATAASALADEDLFRNSDFSDGISKWGGDCHSLDSASVDLSTKPASGVVVPLHGAGWTKITQLFPGQPGTFLLTIKYTVSPAISFSQRPRDYFNATGQLGLGAIEKSEPGQWLIVIDNPGGYDCRTFSITPDLGSPDVHTITQTLTLGNYDKGPKGFLLGFPPGAGIVNLQSITLVPQS